MWCQSYLTKNSWPTVFMKSLFCGKLGFAFVLIDNWQMNNDIPLCVYCTHLFWFQINFIISVIGLNSDQSTFYRKGCKTYLIPAVCITEVREETQSKLVTNVQSDKLWKWKRFFYCTFEKKDNNNKSQIKDRMDTLHHAPTITLLGNAILRPNWVYNMDKSLYLLFYIWYNYTPMPYISRSQRQPSAIPSSTPQLASSPLWPQCTL